MRVAGTCQEDKSSEQAETTKRALATMFGERTKRKAGLGSMLRKEVNTERNETEGRTSQPLA